MYSSAEEFVGELFSGLDGRGSPAEEPFGGLRCQVDAAVAARATIVVVPVGAMEGNPTFGDVQYPGHAGQVEAVGGNVAGGHVTGRTFIEGDEATNGRGPASDAIAVASGGTGGEHQPGILIGQDKLLGQVDFDQFLGIGDIR